MGIELELIQGMAGLEALGRELQDACLTLGLSHEMTGWVVAAGLSAGSAVVLAGGGEPRLVLDKGLSRVTLSLAYAPAPESKGAIPPGLAGGLFSPPALRVNQREEAGRAVWSAVWEV